MAGGRSHALKALYSAGFQVACAACCESRSRAGHVCAQRAQAEVPPVRAGAHQHVQAWQAKSAVKAAWVWSSQGRLHDVPYMWLIDQWITCHLLVGFR
jgi:hypothetical protein